MISSLAKANIYLKMFGFFKVYWSNETGHLIERQSMLINEVLYDRETYL